MRMAKWVGMGIDNIWITTVELNDIDRIDTQMNRSFYVIQTTAATANQPIATSECQRWVKEYDDSVMYELCL